MWDSNGLAWVVAIYSVIFGLICAGVAIGLEHLIPYLWHLIPYLWHHIHWHG